MTFGDRSTQAPPQRRQTAAAKAETVRTGDPGEHTQRGRETDERHRSLRWSNPAALLSGRHRVGRGRDARGRPGRRHALPAGLNVAPYFTFGRLRPLHTNAVIFAFVGNMIFAGVYYSTQRLLKTRMARSETLLVASTSGAGRPIIVGGGHHVCRGLHAGQGVRGARVAHRSWRSPWRSGCCSRPTSSGRSPNRREKQLYVASGSTSRPAPARVERAEDDPERAGQLRRRAGGVRAAARAGFSFSRRARGSAANTYDYALYRLQHVLDHGVHRALEFRPRRPCS